VKFAVGYQLPGPDEEPIVDVIEDYREHIAEVYFPWADMPSGRAPLATSRGYTDWTAQRQLEQDLYRLREMGIKLDVLFNAACYGGNAISEWLENKVRSVFDYMQAGIDGADIATTTSPFVARTIQKYHPQVEVRASINMKIGTIKGMQYLADVFDSYHVQREHNRDLEYLRELRGWADANDKKLIMLANSGCMIHCSGQAFHDNMVAHEQQIDECLNVRDWSAHTCWRFLEDPANRVCVLQNTWVRPEDLHRYEDLFPVVKLATRMHARPRAVLDAYTKGRFRGNLLDLMEPGFGPAFAPAIIDNTRFPEDWFERTSTCDRRCHACEYCAEVLEQVLVDFGV
jgi:collagenase-like PrtC family protease